MFITGLYLKIIDTRHIPSFQSLFVIKIMITSGAYNLVA